MFRFLGKIVHRILRIPSRHTNTAYREKLLCVQASQWYPGTEIMFGERVSVLCQDLPLSPGCWVICMPDLSVRVMHNGLFHKCYERIG